MDPLVSVIIPVYNRQHTLDRLFESLKKITYPKVEILLVDNGSSDSSVSMCKNFAKEINCDKDHYPLFKVNVSHEPIKGASAARNLGLYTCKGTLVYFFDSDDEMSPKFISKMVKCFMHHPKADLVVTQTIMVMPDKSLKTRAFVLPISVANHILSSALSTQSFMARKDYVISVGGWNETLPKWNDYELGVRLLLNTNNIYRLKGAYHRIYQHGDSITGSSLSSTFWHILVALHSIELDLRHAHQHKFRQQGLLALYFREEIIVGKILREGKCQTTEFLYLNAQKILPLFDTGKKKKALIQTIGYLLRQYTQKGYKGTWRFALYCWKALILWW